LLKYALMQHKQIRKPENSETAMSLYHKRNMPTLAGRGIIFFISLCLILLTSAFQPAKAWPSSATELDNFISALEKQCKKYGWNDINLREIPWEHHRLTKNKNPLIFAHYGNSDKNCVLFLGGVHGDELPTVYLMLRLAHYIKNNGQLFNDRCLVVAPVVNPDGFLANLPQRTNSNGIDANRNFPTKDWHRDALRQWKNKARSNKRYYPGTRPASEQETLFQMALIKRFSPQKILSVHSPLNFFDYDGASSDLDTFEQWMEKICIESIHPLKKYGFFPGSLGNYAGNERGIFTLTLELPTSNPGKGNEYFRKFQTAIMKFINIPAKSRDSFSD